MRTQEEILQKIEDYKSDDFFGHKRGDLIDFLTFENARPFLKEGVTAEQWEPTPNTQEAIKAKIIEYMPFAWGKANDMRGLSASRSIEHMEAWIWMYGEEGLWDKIEAIGYEHYGKQKLIAICEHFGFDWKPLDNGERTNG